MSTTRHLFLLVFLALMCSCSKEGKFLGTDDYSTEVIIKAYTSSGNDDYVKIQIGDTVINKLSLSGATGLDQVLDYKFRLPKDGRAKIKIWWKNTQQVIADTTVVLASVNELYLVQLDPAKPHEFSTQFGNNDEPLPDSLDVKTRFVYIKDTLGTAVYPDTVLLRFVKLYTDQSQNYLTIDEDTFDVTLVNGQVSQYLTLPDSRLKTIDGNNVYEIVLGYQIIDPSDTTILKDFCYDIVPVGIVDYRSISSISYKFQTVKLAYTEAGQTCPYGVAKETYELTTLFGNK